MKKKKKNGKTLLRENNSFSSLFEDKEKEAS